MRASQLVFVTCIDHMASQLPMPNYRQREFEAGESSHQVKAQTVDSQGQDSIRTVLLVRYLLPVYASTLSMYAARLVVFRSKYTVRSHLYALELNFPPSRSVQSRSSICACLHWLHVQSFQRTAIFLA